MNTTTYGKKSVRCPGLEIRNLLLEHLEAENTFTMFQNYFNTWFGKKCLRNICKFITWISSLIFNSESTTYFVLTGFVACFFCRANLVVICHGVKFFKRKQWKLLCSNAPANTWLKCVHMQIYEVFACVWIWLLVSLFGCLGVRL